jgi:transposase
MKQHMMDLCLKMAQGHKDIAAAHKKRMDATTGDEQDHHEACMKAHAGMASSCLDVHKALDEMPAVAKETNLGTNFDGKALTASNAAMMADDLTRRFDQLQETGAHKVLGDVPDSSLRLINRSGGAPINSDPVADLDAQLAKLGPRQAIV